MSVQSNKGVIYYATGNGSGTGATTLPEASTATSVAVNVQLAERLVFTIHHVLSTATFSAITYQIQVLNTNLFGTLTAGTPNPAISGGSVRSEFVVSPILAVAQNETDSPGVNALTHRYTRAGGTQNDFIEVSGPLSGTVSVLITTTGAGALAAADTCTIALDQF